MNNEMRAAKTRKSVATKARRTRRPLLGAGLVAFVLFVSSWQTAVHAADDPKQIVTEAQKRTDVYHGIIIETGYRIDLLVDEKVIVEVKSVESILPLHEAHPWIL